MEAVQLKKNISKLVKHPEILRALIEFNLMPALYIDPSWRSVFFPEASVESFWYSERATKHISKEILSQLQLSQDFYFDFSNPLLSFALLEAKKIQRLVRYVTAVVFRKEIKNALSQSEVLYWKNLIGYDAVEFSLKSASLFKTGRIEGFSRGEIDIKNFASTLVSSVFINEPDSLLKRFCLKVPRHTSSIKFDKNDAISILFPIYLTLEGAWHSSIKKISF